MINVSKPNVETFKKAFQQAMAKAHATFCSEPNNPVFIKVKRFFPRPKKHFVWNKGTQQFHLSSTAPVHVTKAPDLDNCLKLILDALQGIICPNDSQVAQITATKLFDHTQTVWNEKAFGCTLIKVTQVDESSSHLNCVCDSCKLKRKIKH